MPEQTRYDYIASLVTQVDNGEIKEEDAVGLIEEWDRNNPYNPEEVEENINTGEPGKPVTSMDDVAESAPVEVESGDSIWETDLLELPKQVDGPKVEVIGEMSPTDGTINDQITASVNNVVSSMSLGIETDAQSLMDDVNENIRQEKKEELAATADDELKPITDFNTFEEYSEYLAQQVATGRNK